MTFDKDRLIRILSYGNFGGTTTTDEYYVRVAYDGFQLCLRPENNRVEFWVQEPGSAYLPVSVPHGETHNAYISKAIRWAFGKLLAELSDQQKPPE